MCLYHGWNIVAASFATHFVSLGTVYSAGIYFLPIANTFAVGHGAAAWVASIWVATMLGMSYPCGILLDRLPAMPVFVGGAALLATGLFCVSLAHNIWLVYATSLLVGLGLALVGPTSAAVVQPWFGPRRGIATGLAMAGSGCGNFAFALVLQMMVTIFDENGCATTAAAGYSSGGASVAAPVCEGWRSSLKYQALGVAIIGMSAGITMRRPRPDEYDDTNTTGNETTKDDSPECSPDDSPADDVKAALDSSSSITATPAMVALTISSVAPPSSPTALPHAKTIIPHNNEQHNAQLPHDVDQGRVLRLLMRTRAFRCLAGYKLAGAFGYGTPFIHVPAFAIEQGMSARTASWVLSAMGIALIAGRLVVGLAADRYGRANALKVCVLTMGFACWAWPFCTTPGLLIGFAAVYGFNAGAYPSLPPSIIADLFSQRTGDTYLFRLSGFTYTCDMIGAILGPPITGWLYDYYGNYLAGGLFTGSALILGAIVIFFIPDQADHVSELDTLLRELYPPTHHAHHSA